jgi:hypothetical protein
MELLNQILVAVINAAIAVIIGCIAWAFYKSARQGADNRVVPNLTVIR